MAEIFDNNGTVMLPLDEYNDLRDELAAAKEKLESLSSALRDYEHDPTSKFIIITRETYYDPYVDDDVTNCEFEFKALDEFKDLVETLFKENNEEMNQTCETLKEKLAAQTEEFKFVERRLDSALDEIEALKKRPLWKRILNK